MLGHDRREARSARHLHEYTNHNVGADLQRRVGRVCVHISISSTPPTDLRSEMLEVKTGLFGGCRLTVSLAGARELVLSQPRFGEPRSWR